MPQGSKAAYSSKQKKQAAHIEAGYEQQGIPSEKAKAIAWATVNKQSGGGELSGSGKNTSSEEKAQARSDSAHHAADTKREKAQPNALETQTKTELLAKARAKNISGRATMNKPELILALRNNK